jgi:hypothetical protein
MRRSDVTIATAIAGAWIFWSAYTQFSTLSQSYGQAELAKSGELPNPTYDLSSLPWQLAKPRTFDVQSGAATLVTSDEPFAYQAFATVNRNGADSALIQYDIDIESGGTTVGLLQSGKWIAMTSSTRPGTFAGTNSALLGYGRTLTVVIANNNPAGASRLTVKSLRLYLRQ